MIRHFWTHAPKTPWGLCGATDGRKEYAPPKVTCRACRRIMAELQKCTPRAMNGKTTDEELRRIGWTRSLAEYEAKHGKGKSMSKKKSGAGKKKPAAKKKPVAKAKPKARKPKARKPKRQKPAAKQPDLFTPDQDQQSEAEASAAPVADPRGYVQTTIQGI